MNLVKIEIKERKSEIEIKKFLDANKRILNTIRNDFTIKDKKVIFQTNHIFDSGVLITLNDDRYLIQMDRGDLIKSSDIIGGNVEDTDSDYASLTVFNKVELDAMIELFKSFYVNIKFYNIEELKAFLILYDEYLMEHLNFNSGLEYRRYKHIFGDSILPRIENELCFKIVNMACGKYHSVAIDNHGRVYAWGDSSNNQLDIPPELNNGLSASQHSNIKIVKIVCGDYHSVALDDQGRVYQWGGTPADLYFWTDVPPQLTDGSVRVVKIACGHSHSVALDNQGMVYVWGYNGYNRLNIPEELTDGSLRIVKIACGSNHSIAVDDQGRVYAWGNNQEKQLNIPTELTDGSVRIVKIACGSDHSVAIDYQGRVYTWGYKRKVQVNIPTKLTDRSVRIVKIACGQYYSMALDNRGRVYTWGYNQDIVYTWGDKKKDPLTIPTELTDGSIRITKIACQAFNWVAVDDKGKLYYSKRENILEPGIPNPSVKIIKVVSRYTHTLALDNEWKIYAWGYPRDANNIPFELRY